MRSKVEWSFRILKRVVGGTKVRSCGLKKNHEWLPAVFALVNSYEHRKRLVPLGGSVSGGRNSAFRRKSNYVMPARQADFYRNSGGNCIRISWHRGHSAKLMVVEGLLTFIVLSMVSSISERMIMIPGCWSG